MRRIFASSIAAVAIAASVGAIAATEAAAQQNRNSNRTITVTIEHVKGLDVADAFSKGDFFARVTVNGKVSESQPIKQQGDIRPNWKLTHTVPSGPHNVTLEIFDKDLTKIEAIDINRVDNKRQLDFTVDTRSCRITGLTGISRCGQKIVRAGAERKRAEVEFTVSVAR